jgi:peroxiredoxin
MTSGRRAAAVLALLAFPAVGAQSSSFPDEATLLKGMGLDRGVQVTYLDADRHPITFQRFGALMSHGGTANFEKSTDTDSVVVAFKPGKPRISGVTLAHKQLPAFDLTELDGNTIRNTDLLGRYTLINFFFNDCAPCNVEVPVLNAFAATHPEVKVLAMTLDAADVAKKFLDRRQLVWPIAVDAKALINTLGINTYPTLAVVDPRGRIVASQTGGVARGSGQDDLHSLEAWFAKARTP